MCWEGKSGRVYLPVLLLGFQKSSLEQSLEETRGELLVVRTNHADTVSSLEAQVNHLSYPAEQ